MDQARLNNWQWQFICIDISQLLPVANEAEKVDRTTSCVDLQVSLNRHLRSLNGEECKAVKNAIALLRRNNVSSSESAT